MSYCSKNPNVSEVHTTSIFRAEKSQARKEQKLSIHNLLGCNSIYFGERRSRRTISLTTSRSKIRLCDLFSLVSCLAYSSTLEIKCSSETSDPIWRYESGKTIKIQPHVACFVLKHRDTNCSNCAGLLRSLISVIAARPLCLSYAVCLLSCCLSLAVFCCVEIKQRKTHAWRSN
jgi:hypothetical protein